MPNFFTDYLDVQNAYSSKKIDIQYYSQNLCGLTDYNWGVQSNLRTNGMHRQFTKTTRQTRTSTDSWHTVLRKSTVLLKTQPPFRTTN